MTDISRFKAKDYYNSWLTRALFVETSVNPELVLYTLKPHDVDGYPSLKRLYLELSDTTEYVFATTYLGGWDHWQELTQCGWFQQHLEKWRTELELKLQAEAFIRIREEAEADGRNAFQANRFLANKGWISDKAETSRRGRPSKTEIRNEAIRQAEKLSKAQEDLKRLEELN